MALRIVHLMASPFVGGPERQVLGLARHLLAEMTTIFLSFPEHGKAAAFLHQARTEGFEAHPLRHNFPRVRQATSEIAGWLRRLRADLVCTSGYKPDLLGWRAARQVGIPVVSISHGWTAATWKVRCYEALDRLVLRWMDAVVAVSQAQALKVKAAGVANGQLVVIQNAVGDEAFRPPDTAFGQEMRGWFKTPPSRLIGAAGRLSPEKGFNHYIEAAIQVAKVEPEVGFVLFGDGPLRPRLAKQIKDNGLEGRFILPGFRSDVDRFLPHLHVGVLTSHTEGLPVILLEMGAAGVPVIATRVGGIPEVVTDGVTGYLMSPGQPDLLARRILTLLGDEVGRLLLGQRLQETVRRQFSLTQQSKQYAALFHALMPRGRPPAEAWPIPSQSFGILLSASPR